MSSLLSYKRPHGFGRVTVKKSGLKSSRWKAGCVERRTSGLEWGKGRETLPYRYPQGLTFVWTTGITTINREEYLLCG
jgi:hypothetical protein